MTMFTNALSARALVKTYPGVNALAGVSLTIPNGQLVAVMGPSGSGKSTLLHCLSGVLLPNSGAVCLGETPISQLGDSARSALRLTKFGFVFQDGQLIDELPVRENIALPLLLQGVSRGRALAAADEWCLRLGIAEAGNRRPGEISGGQAQRAAVARALIHQPEVVFADEPTGALDQATGMEVMQILTTTVKQAGATMVVVTHDRNVASWCERLVEIRDGLVFSDQRLDNPPATNRTPTPIAPARSTR